MMENGIFILTINSEEKVIDDCIKLLQDTKLKARLIGVTKHDEYEGIVARFNCGSAQIKELLRNKLLNNDDASSIHSLTTALAIENAFPTLENDFTTSLQEQIQNMSPVQVLGISKVPVSIRHPKVSSGRWIIILNVPEVDELPVFKSMRLPDGMVLISPDDGKDLRVRFHCRLCNKDGHIQWRCLNGDSSARSVEFLCESPSKKARIEESYASSQGECSMGRYANKASLETIPCPLAMPEDIKNLVLEVDLETLSCEKLEAYVNHVQDELDPASFTEKYYTTNIDGLREQMTEISRRFYGQTRLLSEANKKFMRLLRNVLERLPDGHS